MIIKKNYKYKTDLMSQKAFDNHMVLYSNYVNNINNKTNELQLNTYDMNGVILHDFFFENITEKNDLISKFMSEFFNDYFNGYDNWKQNIFDLAMRTKNRGWILTVWSKLLQSFYNIQLDSHDYGLSLDMKVICCLDTYEHSYVIDYGADKKQYINQFFKCINWQMIEKRIKNIAMC